MKPWTKQTIERWRRFGADTRGATMVEYVIILCLVFLVAFKAWDTLGKNLKGRTDDVAGKLVAPP